MPKPTKKQTKAKSQWGGARENAGGAREGAGRPPQDEHERASKSFRLRVDLMARAQAKADEEGKTLTAFIEAAIEKALG